MSKKITAVTPESNKLVAVKPSAPKTRYQTEDLVAEGLYQHALTGIEVTDQFNRTYAVKPASAPASLGEYKDLFTGGVRVATPDASKFATRIEKAGGVIQLVHPDDRAIDTTGNVFGVSYTLCGDDTWRCVAVLHSVTPEFLARNSVAMLADFKEGLTAVHEQNGALAKAQRDLATKLAGLERKCRQEVAHAEAVGRDQELLAAFFKARAELHERRGDLFEAILKQYADFGSWTVTDDGKSVLHTTEPGYELAMAALNNALAVAARG